MVTFIFKIWTRYCRFFMTRSCGAFVMGWDNIFGRPSYRVKVSYISGWLHDILRRVCDIDPRRLISKGVWYPSFIVRYPRVYDIPALIVWYPSSYRMIFQGVRYPRSYCTISQGVWCMISLLMLYDIPGCAISPLLLYDIYVRTIPFRHSPASRGRHITLLADKTPAYLSPALTLIYLSQSWQTFIYLSQTLSIKMATLHLAKLSYCPVLYGYCMIQCHTEYDTYYMVLSFTETM